jgi:hypothetical protein
MNATTDRFTTGILAAWATEVVVSLVVGCVYSISGAGGLASLKLPDAGSGIFWISSVFAFIGAVVGFVATLALGVPILKLFIRRGYTSGPAFLGAGIIISAALGAVFYGSHQFGEKLMDMDFHFAMIAVFISGPLAGLSFWLLYRRQ